VATAKLPLLKHQGWFCSDNEHKFLALIGGYGSGKTRALAAKAVLKCVLNPGLEGGILSPTLTLAKEVVVPAIDEVLGELGLRYNYTGSPQPKYRVVVNGAISKINIKSFENTKRLVGSNWAWAGIDEIDTVEPKLARLGLNKVIGRCRVGRGVSQIFMVSTPEGYRMMWEFFERDAKDKNGLPKPDRRIIRAKSTDNPFLEKSIIESMEAQYSPELLKAYMHGEFCNLEQLTVYFSFDRDLNACDDVAIGGEDVHVGMDFNVGKMAAIVHILRDGQPRAVDEFIDLKNTTAMIEALKAHYGRRSIYIYPDASGEYLRSTSASVTDLDLLRQAGFTVIVNPANPLVKDRINAMNSAFLNGLGERRYLVNPETCPRYVAALEQQAWVKGKPDKSSGIDHCLDAAGYFIHNHMPIERPVSGVVSLGSHTPRAAGFGRRFR
jgi:hypothetical protein